MAPQPAAVLVLGEVIAEVRILGADPDFSVLMQELADWNPVLLEHYYLSPGLVDCNAQVNGSWDDYSSLTRAAVSGGVTFLLVQPSLYHPESPPVTSLYCDIGRVALLGRSSLDDVLAESQGAFALKGYLYPPSAYVTGIAGQLESALTLAEDTDLPLFLDSLFPNSRQLYLVSPCRLLPLEEREKQSHFGSDQCFAGAFPEEIEPQSSSSSSPCDDDEKDAGSLSPEITDSRPFRQASGIPQFLSTREEFLPPPVQLEKTPEKFRNRRKSLQVSTLFTDLDKRIHANQSNIENLSKVELMGYVHSGNTQYTRRQSCICLGTTAEPETAAETPAKVEVQPAAGGRFRFKRPAGLEIRKEVPKQDAQEKNYLVHLASHPDQWETSGIIYAWKRMKLKPRAQVHFCNLSAAGAFSKLAKLQSNSDLRVTTETCPHYLYFTMESVSDGDTRFKTHPPIRNKSNCNLLWDLLKLEHVDIVASNHCLVDPRSKFLDSGSFKRALSGLPGLGFSLQALWTKLRSPTLSMEALEHYLVRLSKWLSTAPAKLLRVNRGLIAPGRLADIVVWSPEELVTAACIGSHPELCPYGRQELYGQILRVYIRGEVAFDRGQISPIGRVESR